VALRLRPQPGPMRRLCAAGVPPAARFQVRPGARPGGRPLVGQQPPSGCQPQAAMPESLPGCRPAAASAAPDLGQRGRRPDAHPACVTIMPVMLGQPLERSPSPESPRPGPQNGPRRQAESALANKGLQRTALCQCWEFNFESKGLYGSAGSRRSTARRSRDKQSLCVRVRPRPRVWCLRVHE
jgi:hypothetical protein